MIQSRSLVIVLAVSFFVHATLLVSSARNEVDRAQQPVGELLASQLAGNAAPLMINRDSVGLGLLADRVGQTPGILSLKIIQPDEHVAASGGNAPTLSGRVFHAPIALEQKALGTAEVVLAGPAQGDVLRANGIPLLLSLTMHVLLGCWLIWPQRFQAIRVPILQPLPRRRREDKADAAPVAADVYVPAVTVLLQVALEDSKGLLQRVNASTADQMLMILEKLLLRSARLYHGKVMHTFGPEGATVRFEGDDAAACLQQALSCGRLFLSLSDAAYQQRRTAKLFALPVKAAIGELGEREEGVVLDEIMQLARRGSAQELLLTVNENLVEPLKSGSHLESLDPPPSSEPVKTEGEESSGATEAPANEVSETGVESVYRFTHESVEYLFDQGCELVILACNTASAKALRTIQQHDLPLLGPQKRVLGVIRPSVEAIGQVTRTGHVGVLATPGTVKSDSYVLELAKLYPHVRVYQQACPMWVPLVENGEYDSPGADYFVERHVKALLAQSPDIDTVVLGCTHYPLLIPKIRQYLPGHITLLNQGQIVAESLKEYLYRHPEMDARLTRTASRTFLTTENPELFNRPAGMFFGENVSAYCISVS